MCQSQSVKIECPAVNAILTNFKTCMHLHLGRLYIGESINTWCKCIVTKLLTDWTMTLERYIIGRWQSPVPNIHWKWCLALEFRERGACIEYLEVWHYYTWQRSGRTALNCNYFHELIKIGSFSHEERPFCSFGVFSFTKFGLTFLA